MIRIEEIVEKVRLSHPEADLDLLRRAYFFSAREHKGQMRASGEPYLVHPLEVANILADMRLDAVSVATGLLHDVVEDTLVEPQTIREMFGEDVSHLVEGLTKIAQISNQSKEVQQAENVRKMLLAMVDDVRVVLVKLADRLHNMRTLQHLKPEKRQRIAQETLDIFAPIAHRLGMGKMRGELEDLAFRHLHPEEYRSLAAQLEQRRAEHEAFLAATTATIEEKLRRGSRQTSLLDLQEAEATSDRVGSGLRPRRRAHHHTGQRRALLLRCARRAPQHLEARPRSLQGLDRHAARQPLPVAPHFGHRAGRAALRDSDQN
jgi:guanosine-3',5'-bis(diphosphate) 3'-pyrophosphohydrolase